MFSKEEKERQHTNNQLSYTVTSSKRHQTHHRDLYQAGQLARHQLATRSAQSSTLINMGSCMSTPSDEPKHTPESSKPKTTSSANTSPAAGENGNAHPSTPVTAPNSASTPQSNDRSSLGASGGNHDRGSDAQAISAALAATEGSIEKRGSKDRSNAIDRQLEDDQRKFKKECKILLLGRCCFLLESGVSSNVLNITSTIIHYATPLLSIQE